MKKLQQLSEKSASRKNRVVSIYSSLLGLKPLAYLHYRLRFFIISLLISLIVHIVEFTLLYRLTHTGTFISIIVLRSIFVAFMGGWWGALEIQRKNVRYYFHTNQKNKLAQEIAHWLALTAIIIVILLIGFMPTLITGVQHIFTGRTTVFDVYMFTLFIQLALQLTTRTLHSGCYAIKRIYRPFRSIILSDIISLAAILLLLPLLHQYSLPIALLIGGISGSWMSIYYSNNMYRFIKISYRAKIRLKQFLHFLQNLYVNEFLFALTSGILMQVESVLILLLLYHAAHHDHSLHTTIVLYFISPMIRASFDWVRLFYYDFKKYNGKLYLNMINNLTNSIMKMSIIIASLFWLISLLINIYFNIHDIYYSLVLLPFFLLRSVLARHQIEKFCNNRYHDVMYSGVIVLGSMLTMFLFHTSSVADMTIIIAAMAAACVFLAYSRQQKVTTISKQVELKPFYDWLENLLRQTQSLIVHSISIPREAARSTALDLPARLDLLYHYHGQLCQSHENELLYFEVDNPLTVLQAKNFSVALGGNILQYQTFQGNNAPGLIYQYLQQSDKDYSKQHSTPRAIIADFKQQFSSGIVLDIKKPFSTTTNFSEEIFNNIVQSLNVAIRSPFINPTIEGTYTQILLDKKAIRYIFIVPNVGAMQNELTKWGKSVGAHNIQTIVSSVN